MCSTSEKPRVIFRADAGPVTGYGHLARCCALAGYLRDDFLCEIASFNPEGTAPVWVEEMIERAGACRLHVAGNSTAEFGRNFLDILCKEDTAVLDNYYLDTEYQLEVKRRVKALVCLDDLHERHFAADLLLTPSPLRREDFSLESGTLFYGGVRHAFLREPFLQPLRRREERGEYPERIVVAIGGADPLRIGHRIVGMLTELLPGRGIDYIGNPVPDISAHPSVKIWTGINAEKMRDILDSADMGIFPASTVCIEAFSRKLPVAVGYFTDNQLPFYQEGCTQRWFEPLGNLSDPEELLRQRLRSALQAYPTLRVPDFDFKGWREEIPDIFKKLKEKR